METWADGERIFAQVAKRPCCEFHSCAACQSKGVQVYDSVQQCAVRDAICKFCLRHLGHIYIMYNIHVVTKRCRKECLECRRQRLNIDIEDGWHNSQILGSGNWGLCWLLLQSCRHTVVNAHMQAQWMSRRTSDFRLSLVAITLKTLLFQKDLGIAHPKKLNNSLDVFMSIFFCIEWFPRLPLYK